MAHHHPAYIGALKDGTLKKRVDQALSSLDQCKLCPRACGVDRNADETGFCNTGRLAMVASHGPHFGEEQPLVGQNGSGTIFFTHCNLRCIFCQNYSISHLGEGREVDDEQLASMMLELARMGCHNINFVTPSHVVPQILSAVYLAAQKGLSVPLVYNSGGYDAVDTLRLLDGIVDIYMPDFKFWDSKVAQDTCDAPDYPEVAKKSLMEMHRQVGDLCIDENNQLVVRGLLVRHLVLPGGHAGTSSIMGFLAESLSKDTYVNVMAQYRPCGRAKEVAALANALSPAEYDQAVQEARVAGLTRLDKPRRVFALW